MRATWVMVLAGCGFSPSAAQSTLSDGTPIDGPHDGQVQAQSDAPRDGFSGYSIRYNIGGAQYTGSSEHPGTWLADTEPGGVCDCTVFPAPNNTTSINGTVDTALYAKLPYATPLTCAFPNLPTGTYTLRMLFAETYRGNAPCVGGAGTRQLTIAAEGVTIDPLFDLTATGGGCAVVAGGVDGGGHIVDKTYTGVTITDGTLNLTITGNAINGILDAIEIDQTAD